MRRPRALKGHQNHERWLITYSDLITLLMIFFVIMYAMSSIDQAKFKSLSASLKEALQQSSNIPVGAGGGHSLLAPDNANGQSGNQTIQVNTKNDQQLDNLYELVKQYIASHNLADNISIENQARGVQITLKDVVLFDTGSAVIKPQAQILLAGLVPFFKSLPNQIVIEGYTDNQPIDTSEYPSNWELSAARAMGVVRFLVSQGIDPERLSGIGYGQYHAAVPNFTPDERQMNRRINIVILRESIEPGTPASEPAQTAIDGFANSTTP